MTFKVGNMVECINAKDSSSTLKKGEIYEVLFVDKIFIGVHYNKGEWFINRFKLVNPKIKEWREII